jgi:hypothetical protein
MLFATARTRSRYRRGSGTIPRAFTLANYVHLLPGDLPDPDFLDRVTAEAPEADAPDERAEAGAAAR